MSSSLKNSLRKASSKLDQQCDEELSRMVSERDMLLSEASALLVNIEKKEDEMNQSSNDDISKHSEILQQLLSEIESNKRISFQELVEANSTYDELNLKLNTILSEEEKESLQLQLDVENDAINSDIVSNPVKFSDNYKKKIETTSNKMSGIFNKGKNEYSKIIESMKSDKDLEMANATSIEQKAAMVPVLRTKIKKLKKNEEVVELKFRAIEIQMKSDRAKFLDIINLNKKEIQLLTKKLQNYDSKHRNDEQINRDPNMVENAVSKAEFEEALLKCENLKEVILKEGLAKIELEKELHEVKFDLEQAHSQIMDLKLANDRMLLQIDELKDKENRFNLLLAEKQEEHAREVKSIQDAFAVERSLNQAKLDEFDQLKEFNESLVLKTSQLGEALSQMKLKESESAKLLEKQNTSYEIMKVYLSKTSTGMSGILEAMKVFKKSAETKLWDNNAVIDQLQQRINSIRENINVPNKGSSPRVSSDDEAMMGDKATISDEVTMERRHILSAEFSLESAVSILSNITAKSDDLNVDTNGILVFINNLGAEVARLISSTSFLSHDDDYFNNEIVKLVSGSTSKLNEILEKIIIDGNGLVANVKESYKGYVPGEYLTPRSIPTTEAEVAAAALKELYSNAIMIPAVPPQIEIYPSIGYKTVERIEFIPKVIVNAESCTQTNFVTLTDSEIQTEEVNFIMKTNEVGKTSEEKINNEIIENIDIPDDDDDDDDDYTGLINVDETMMETLKEELKSKVNLLALGEITKDNFDRLKGGEFGPDNLIHLSYLEYHVNYDKLDNDDPDDDLERAKQNNAKYKMQKQTMRLERNSLMQTIIDTMPIDDLSRFRQAAEKKILMIGCLDVLKLLAHYRSGGIYLDILKVHRIVIDKCIAGAGGWKKALKSLNQDLQSCKNDSSVLIRKLLANTDHWPDFFRVKVLEVYRNNMNSIVLQSENALNESAKDIKSMQEQLLQGEEKSKGEKATLLAEIERIKSKKRGDRNAVTKNTSSQISNHLTAVAVSDVKDLQENIANSEMIHSYRRLHQISDQLILLMLNGDDEAFSLVECVLDGLSSWKDGYFLEAEETFSICLNSFSNNFGVVLLNNLNRLLVEFKTEFSHEVSEVTDKLELFLEYFNHRSMKVDDLKVQEIFVPYESSSSLAVEDDRQNINDVVSALANDFNSAINKLQRDNLDEIAQINEREGKLQKQVYNMQKMEEIYRNDLLLLEEEKASLLSQIQECSDIRLLEAKSQLEKAEEAHNSAQLMHSLDVIEKKYDELKARMKENDEKAARDARSMEAELVLQREESKETLCKIENEKKAVIIDNKVQHKQLGSEVSSRALEEQENLKLIINSLSVKVVAQESEFKSHTQALESKLQQVVAANNSYKIENYALSKVKSSVESEKKQLLKQIDAMNDTIKNMNGAGSTLENHPVVRENHPVVQENHPVVRESSTDLSISCVSAAKDTSVATLNTISLEDASLEKKKVEDIIIGASVKEEHYKREIERLMQKLNFFENNKIVDTPMSSATSTTSKINVSDNEEHYKREIERLMHKITLLESVRTIDGPATTANIIDISAEKEEQYKHTISALLTNMNSLENDNKELLKLSATKASNSEVATEPIQASNNHGLKTSIQGINIAKEFSSLRAQRKKAQQENENRIKEIEARIDTEVKSKVADELKKMIKESVNIWTQTEIIDATDLSSQNRHSKEIMGHFSLEDEVDQAVDAIESITEADASVDDYNAEKNVNYSYMRRRSIFGANDSGKIGLEQSITLPPGFHLVHVRNKELELCPGVILATTSYHGHDRKTLPKDVIYCYRSGNAAYLKGLKKLPSYIPAPKVPNCEAILIPPIFEVSDGIKLIHGASLGKSNSIELPPDILVIKIEKKGAILPSGLTIVSFSNIIKIPETMIDAIPPDVIVVQMNTNVLLPVGVEVAPGCNIVETPEELILPDNVVLVTLEKGKLLPPFMTALSATPEEEIAITLNTSITSGCTIVKKPTGIMFGLGVEIIHRWHGHPMPFGMAPLPLCEHPKGLHLGGNYELIRLTPRFDFPTTCSPSPGWTFFAKPFGLRLPPHVHLIKYIDDRGGGVLPNFMREVMMPDLPYEVRTKIPVSVIAAEFLPGVDLPLPAGTTLAPGVKVLSLSHLKLQATNDADGFNPNKSFLPLNAVLVYREPNSVLPSGVERGSRSDLPENVLLEPNMEILLLSVRFELPTGVKLEPNVKLGHGTQLAPGTVLSRDLTVMEWPRGVVLPPGVELVHLVPGAEIPEGFKQIHMLPSDMEKYSIPAHCIIVKLPNVIHLQSTQQIAEQIKIVHKHELDAQAHMHKDKLEIPNGVTLIRRERRSSIIPSDMRVLTKTEVPYNLRQFLTKRDFNVSDSHVSDIKQPIEAVQLEPTYNFPPGTEIFPGVFVLPKPHWLHTTAWTELVIITSSVESRDKYYHLMESLRIRIRPEHIFIDSISEKSANEVTFPAGTELIYIPSDLQVFSWGAGCKNIEAVVKPDNMYLPRAHFLVQRASKNHLPGGLAEGFASGYEKMAIWSQMKLLPPGVEVVHLVPSYHLPLGADVIDTSVLLPSTVLTMSTLLYSIPVQLSCFQALSQGVHTIPSPYGWDASALTESGGFIKQKAVANPKVYCFVVINTADYKLPIGAQILSDSDQIVIKYFGHYEYYKDLDPIFHTMITLNLYNSSFAVDFNDVDTPGIVRNDTAITNFIKIIELPNTLPTLRDRLKIEPKSLGYNSSSTNSTTNDNAIDRAVVINPRVRADIKRVTENLDMINADSSGEELAVSNSLIKMMGLTPDTESIVDTSASSIENTIGDITKDINNSAYSAVDVDVEEAEGEIEQSIQVEVSNDSTKNIAGENSSVDVDLLKKALVMAQQELDDVEVENNNFRLKNTNILREREHLVAKIKRLEKSLADQNEEYRNVRETIANLKASITKGEKMLTFRNEDLRDVQAKAEAMKARMQSQIDILSEQLSLWQDANADFIKHKAKFEEELALKEAESVRRLKEEEDTIRDDYRKVLTIFADTVCKMAETVICESHDRVKVAMNSVQNFIHPDKLTSTTLPPISDYSTKRRNDIEIAAPAHSNTTLFDSVPQPIQEDDDITAVSALSYETGALASESKSDIIKAKSNNNKNNAVTSSTSIISDSTGRFTSIPEILQTQADDDISVLSEDGTYNSGVIFSKDSTARKGTHKLAIKPKAQSEILEFFPIAKKVMPLKLAPVSTTGPSYKSDARKSDLRDVSYASLTEGHVYMANRRLDGLSSYKKLLGSEDVLNYSFDYKSHKSSMMDILEQFLLSLEAKYKFREELREEGNNTTMTVVELDKCMERSNERLSEWIRNALERYRVFCTIEHENYKHALQLSEQEIHILIKRNKSLERKLDSLQSKLQDEVSRQVTGTPHPNNELRETNLTLTETINRMNDFMTKPSVDVLKDMSKQMKELSEMKQQLTFFYLVHKEKANKEYTTAKYYTARPGGESQAKACYHYGVTLDKKAQQFHTRSRIIHSEIKAIGDNIIAFLERFESAISSVLPTDTVTNLLKRSANTLLGSHSSSDNSTIMPSLELDDTANNKYTDAVKSSMSVGAYSTGSSSSSISSSVRSHMSIQSLPTNMYATFGTVGSMPSYSNKIDQLKSFGNRKKK